MIVLDTNVISETLKPAPAPQVMRWLDQTLRAELFTTAVTMAELLVGVSILPAGKRRENMAAAVRRSVDELFGPRILAFDELAAEQYAEIYARARSYGIAISFADGQIAAIAIAHGFAVATRDTIPFSAAGAQVINPWNADA